MDSTQHKPGLYYVTLGHGRSTVLIAATILDGVPPITVSVDYGAFRFSDYFTASEADTLADALRECAQAARHAG